MAYELLESIRRVLSDPSNATLNDPTTGLIKQRVYPTYQALNEAMTDGKFPLIGLSILGSTNSPKNDRRSSTFQLEVVSRENDKKNLWLIEKALVSFLAAGAISDASKLSAPSVITPLKIGSISLETEEDNIFEPDTKTYRLRAQFGIKWHYSS